MTRPADIIPVSKEELAALKAIKEALSPLSPEARRKIIQQVRQGKP